MKRSARFSTAIIAAGLVLAACGTSDGAAPATEAVVATAAPETEGDDLTQNDGTSTGGTAAVDAEAETGEPDPPAETADAEEPAPEPVAVEAPADPADPAEAVIGGRAFASELSADSDFAENLLPDLQVDDIRSGQKANIRNVFPAERPVLIWAWAPH